MEYPSGFFFLQRAESLFKDSFISPNFVLMAHFRASLIFLCFELLTNVLVKVIGILCGALLVKKKSP